MADPYSSYDPPSEEEDDDDNDNDDVNVDVHVDADDEAEEAMEVEAEEVSAGAYPEVAAAVVIPQVIQPRGKPEALAAAAAAAAVDSDDDEEEDHISKNNNNVDVDNDDEDSEDEAPLVMAEPVAAEVVPAVPTVAAAVVTSSSSSKPAAAKKPVAKKKAPSATASSPRKKAAPKTSSAKPKKAANSKKSKAAAAAAAAQAKLDKAYLDDLPDNLLDKEAPPMTSQEYENLEMLMKQFCRVPLLAEFSRPVKLLHPELATNYSKIISHPVDLGHVCRGIRKRKYQNARDIQLDMWRVFANCVKFHSHPQNKEKVPSFVSIALHLREYFNCLWQEYMLPSELPPSPSEEMRQAFTKRSEERKRRLESSGVLMMSKVFAGRVARLLNNFIQDGGRTDGLDKEALFGKDDGESDSRELSEVKQNLQTLKEQMDAMQEQMEECSIEELTRRLQACYSRDEVLEENPALKNRFKNRLDRLVGKLTVPLHEANSRGVTQSSIWGNIATTIWARESGKKPYWPALCLGILPPAEQREGWHAAVTERNESRLPQKLRTQLSGAKKKCEAAQNRQALSYFLVEFLGTHEFIWVRETDIVEKFDPQDDPNKSINQKGKKRASRSAITNATSSKTYATALEECEWATDEFEGVLQDAFDYESEKETEDDQQEEVEFANYSYAILNQSDEEAEETEEPHSYSYDAKTMSLDDFDEVNWLLANDGKMDTSAEARKQAKKRAQAMRKKKALEKEKRDAVLASQKEKKKKQMEAKMKERDAAKEIKDLDRRRKKRSREREKALKMESKAKKKRLSGPLATEEEVERGVDRGLQHENKRARASAIVKSLIHRMSQKEEYQGMHLGGTNIIPSATVESSSLLCMALAFRVAAGELQPDGPDSADYTAKHRPWEKIDADGPKTHRERSENLEKQVKLLEKELERIRHNTQRRKELLFMSVTKRHIFNETIKTDEELARFNRFKKKKPPSAVKNVTKKVPKQVLPTATPKSLPFSAPVAASVSGASAAQDSASEATSQNPPADDATDANDEDMSEAGDSIRESVGSVDASNADDDASMEDASTSNSLPASTSVTAADSES